ncbi:MAG: response regulator [Persicimonas sp.]
MDSTHSDTVLLIEDDAELRSLIKKILQRKGFIVLTAGHGPAALETAKEHDGTIEVVLADVVMPGMTVAKLHEQLVEICPTTRFIFMSGHSKAEMIRRGVPATHTDFVEKPFSNADLADKVREVAEAARADAASE